MPGGIKILNIIIPLYKGKEVIKDCLNSLCAQTKKEFFVTIIQDFDNEDYTEIIKEYNKKLHILFLKNNENIGAGLTRQRGIDVSSRFDYLLFLDVDDILNPRAVELLYTYSKSKFADVTTSKIIVEKKYTKGQVLSGKQANTWLHGKIYRTNYLKDNNIRFHKNIRYNEDVSFNLLALNYTNKVYFLDEETYIWRDYGQSITRKDTSNFTNQSTWQYLYGYAKSMLQLLESNKLTKNLVVTGLMSLYTQSQVLIETNSISKNENIYITELLKTDYMQRMLQDIDILNRIANNNRIGYTESKKPLFFHESFDNWVNRMCGEKII